MKARLKWSLGAALASLLVVLVVHGHQVPEGGALLDGGPYLLSRAAQALVPGVAPLERVEGRLLAALVVLALCGGLLQGLFLRWTGNSLVSLLGALLFVAHPMLRPGGAGAMLRLLPLPFLLTMLLLRQQASRARLEGTPVIKWEALTMLALVGAILSGPAFLVAPVLLLLMGWVFEEDQTRSLLHTSLLIPVGLCLLLTLLGGLWVAPQGPALAAPPGGPAAAFSALLLVPSGGLLGGLVTLLGGGLLLLGLGAFVAGMKARGGTPRWTLLHLGFGVLWFAGASTVASLPGLPPGPWGRALALVGPAFLLPALLWRALMGLREPLLAGLSLPEDARPPQTDREATLKARLMLSVEQRLEERKQDVKGWVEDVAARLPGKVAKQVSRELAEKLPQAVEETLPPLLQTRLSKLLPPAVRLALDEALDRHLPLPPEPPLAGSYALRWERRQAAWEQRFLKQQRLLGTPWSPSELEENLFHGYLLPHLFPGCRVLEIGSATGSFTRLLASHARQVVVVDGEPDHLEALRGGVASLENVSIVKAAGTGLGLLCAGSMDLVFVADAFLRMSPARIYRYLAAFGRVLRPGGRALITFANLLDPEGFDIFRRQALLDQGREPALPAGNFLSPQLVRTLVEGAGLELEALNLAANGHDMLAQIRRSLSAAHPRGGPCPSRSR